MKNIEVIYWSGSGNTEKIASLIAEGAGAKCRHISEVSDPASDASLSEADIIAIGCPALGDEWIDETLMLPFLESARDMLLKKKIALFGSYGWGVGEWLKKWTSSLRAWGIDVLDETLSIREAPDMEGSAKCKEYGKNLAK